MPENDVQPDVDPYTVLINQMLKEGGFNYAHMLLGKMVSLGLWPDLLTFTSFVDAYYNHVRLKEAEDLLDAMKKDQIFPDLLVYTFLIDAYGRSGYLNFSFDVLKRILDSGLSPSHHVYASLLRHILIDNRVKHVAIGVGSICSVAYFDEIDVSKTLDFKDILHLFDRMVQHGCTPVISTKAKLLMGFSKAGSLNVAYRVLEHMREEGMQPDEEKFNALVQCCCEKGADHEALNFIQSTTEQGRLPNPHSCKMLLCGLYDMGEIEEANKMFSSLL